MQRKNCPNMDFFSCPSFPGLGLNTESPYSVKIGKTRTRKTPYLDTFHAVFAFLERNSKLQRYKLPRSRYLQPKYFYTSWICYVFISETWKFWLVYWREVSFTKSHGESHKLFCKKNLANIYLFKAVVETLEKRAKYGVNNFVMVSLIITLNIWHFCLVFLLLTLNM